MWKLGVRHRARQARLTYLATDRRLPVCPLLIDYKGLRGVEHLPIRPAVYSNLRWRPEISIAFDTVAFDRGTDPILGFFNVEQARALVAYRGDQVIRARIEEKNWLAKARKAT
jgi:hypothetical protein